MKERRLAISVDLWMAILKDRAEQHFRVIKNGLPEDARCTGMEPAGFSRTIYLRITSSVFQDDDPLDLPSPMLESVHRS